MIKPCCFFPLNAIISKHAGCCTNPHRGAIPNSSQQSSWGTTEKMGQEQDWDQQDPHALPWLLQHRTSLVQGSPCAQQAGGTVSHGQFAGMAPGAQVWAMRRPASSTASLSCPRKSHRGALRKSPPPRPAEPALKPIIRRHCI